jgi:hypothetical protein
MAKTKEQIATDATFKLFDVDMIATTEAGALTFCSMSIWAPDMRACLRRVAVELPHASIADVRQRSAVGKVSHSA